METEAKVMAYAARHGYPAPRVEEISADGTQLVMERIQGPTMVEAFLRRPWRLRQDAAVLASLHQRLHAIPAPPWLDPFLQGGDCLLHLDLHPLNVIVSPGGPVLIDWANAARGPGAADVALTWLVMAAAEIPAARVGAAVGGILRGMFVRSFLGHFDLAPVRTALSAVGAWKCGDRNMRPSERVLMERLMATASRPG
jgi:aminoglycoside phosphotransferase (APT) family kinase protein